MEKKNNRLFSTSSITTLTSFIRSTIFTSVVTISFSGLVCNAKLYTAYINAIMTIFRPHTGRISYTTAAAKIIVSLPIMVITLSTSFVDALRASSLQIVLPNFLWELLSKYCIRTIRGTNGIEPGLDGSVRVIDIGTDQVDFKLETYLRGVFTPEFVHEVVAGTYFQPIVKRYDVTPKKPLLSNYDNYSEFNSALKEYQTIMESAPIYEFKFDKEFAIHLETELSRFSMDLFTFEFVQAVNLFYSQFNVAFYDGYGFQLSTRQLIYADTERFGIHKFRNTLTSKLYLLISDYKNSFSTETSQNLVICFLVLFNPTFNTIGPDGQLTLSGNYIRLSGDVNLDLQNITYFQAFNSLLSLVITPSGKPENSEPERPTDNSSSKKIRHLEAQIRKLNKRNTSGNGNPRDTKLKPTSLDPNDSKNRDTAGRSYSTFSSSNQPIVLHLNNGKNLYCSNYKISFDWPLTFIGLC